MGHIPCIPGPCRSWDFVRWYFQMILKADRGQPDGGGKKNTWCFLLEKERLKLLYSSILSTLEKYMHETPEEQGGETAYSETTALLGEREIFCVQTTSVVPFPAVGVRKQHREGKIIVPGSFLDYCYLKKHQVHPLPSSLNLHFSLPSSLNSFWISFLLFKRYAVAPGWQQLLHPCRDICLLSVCLCFSCSMLPKGQFSQFLLAIPCSVAPPADL